MPDQLYTSDTIEHRAVQAALKMLKEKTNLYLQPQEKTLLHKAVHYAAHFHQHQKRKSGEPYIVHPIMVTAFLADLQVDVDTLVGGVLHDTIEDTEASFENLSEAFNPEVAALVEGVTKLDKLNFPTAKEAQAGTFVKMLFAMADDIRVILIKLCDRIHNMHTIAAMSASGQRRIAQETLDVYAPIAERLGLKAIQRELEDKAFQTLRPNKYQKVIQAIDTVAGHRKKVVEKIRKNIAKELTAESMPAVVSARQKSAYSCYKKSTAKNIKIEDVYDLFGVRIVVKTLQQCYIALGLIHNLYPPNENGFKDYIAVPKQNGYQSLHTIVKVKSGLIIEVQIRTEEMNQMAESGVAAHWIYKNKSGRNSASLTKARNWLNSLLRLEKDSASSLEFYENMKEDLGSDEIYVFTPKGDVVQLSKHATALDFAFAIHTSVGCRVKKVFVNGEQKTLSQELNTGDIVKIVTAKQVTVHTDWLQHVTSSKARIAIRKELKQIEDSDALVLGHRMLDRAFGTYDYSLDKVDERNIRKTLKHFHRNSMDELLKSLAYGEILPSMVAKRMLPFTKRPRLSGDYSPKEDLIIDGGEGSVIDYANCCQPIPGDQITGHFSKAKGIVIHRKNCINLLEIEKDNPSRLVQSSWAAKTNGLFKSTLLIDARNRTGVLAELAALIADREVNVVTVRQRDKDSGYSQLIFCVEIKSKKRVKRLIQDLQQNPNVLQVHRKYHEKYH